MDPPDRRPPEVEDSLKSLEFDKLRDYLCGLAQFEPARERLFTLTPSADLRNVSGELARVEEARSLTQRGGSFPTAGLRDIRVLLMRASISGSILQAEELLAILHHLHAHRTARTVLDREQAKMPLIFQITQSLAPLPNLEELLEKAISPDATIRDKASPELERIRRQIAYQQDVIHAKLTALIPRLSKQGALREDNFTVRGGRYVLPVRSDQMGKVRGLIHDRSATGGTFFVEPSALIEPGNELRALELAERDEIRRVLADLTRRVRDHQAQIDLNLRAMASLDCLLAKAKLAIDLDATSPCVTADGPIRIVGGRHPLLALAKERRVVPLNLELGVDWTTLVISGPNSGGKSVAMKCVGMICAMAACGLHVPALPGTELPLFTAIHTDIGDQQSIVDDLSTFTAHAGRMRDILERATPRSLVLIDEIGAGTDPHEGASLSIAMLEQLTARKIPTIVTTHHGALKAFAHKTPGCANGSMEFDRKTLLPTFRFHPKLPGSSYALEIAGRAGLPEKLITRAREVLGGERTHLEELIMDLTEKVRHYENLAANEERRAAVQEGLEKAYHKKLEELKGREKTLKQRAKQELENVIAQGRRTVEAAVKEIRERNAVGASIRHAHQVLKSEILQPQGEETGEARERNPEVPQPPSLIPAPTLQPDKSPEVGDFVTIDESETTGEVTALSGRGDRVCVAVGAVQLWLSVDRVTVTHPPETHFITHPQYAKMPDVPFELDVRGLDAPEALRRVDKYLADGYVAGRSKLGIIHGKGQGILSRHIREYLKGQPRVESFRFGEYGEGDYGITIVNLVST